MLPEFFLKKPEHFIERHVPEQEVNVEKVEPMTGGTLRESVVREDDESKCISDNQVIADILNAAPDKENDYFKVPSILK